MLIIQKKYLRQFLAANIASFLLFVCACWIAWPSSSIKKLSQKYPDEEKLGVRLSGSQITWMVALLDLGNAISPFFSSYVMNTIGRKNSLLLASLCFLPTWLLVLDTTSLTYIYISRFLIGISKGLAFTAVPVYIGEISDHNIRGMLVSSMHTYMSLGLLFSLCVGPYVSYTHLNITFSIIPVFFLVMFLLMPESPYYYIMKKDYKSAEKSLAWFKHYSPNIKEELQGMIDNHELVNSDQSYISVIKHRATRAPLIIVMCIAFFQRLSGITSLITYSSITLPKLPFTWFGPDECVICFTFAMFISNVLFASCIETLGRKLLLCISISAGTILSCITSAYYFLYPNPSGNYIDVIPYFSFVAYGIAYFGMGCVPTVLPSEYFSTSYRSFASAAASASFALGSFLTGKSYFIIKDSIGVYFIFLLFAIVHVTYLIFTSSFVIETRGKTLEEIQMTFYKKKKKMDDTVL